MANIFQRMFLSTNKIKEIDKKQKILKLLPKISIESHSTTAARDTVTGTFVASSAGRNIYATRTYDKSRPEEMRVTYALYYHIDGLGTQYATNSNIDKFAQKVYMKMYKAWEKQRVK